jgi:hypothetical protein
MTPPYRGHIVRTTYFSVRGDLFFLGGDLLIALIHRAAEKEGVLGNPRHEKSRGVKAPALLLVGLALRLSLEWAQPY